jgi:GNAT superfamily N-acetyltransferase
VVRAFDEKDRVALEALYRDCRAEADWLPPAARATADFARDTEGETILVATGSNGEILGFVAAWEPDRFIHHLYVRNGSRGRGVGRELLESLGSRLPLPWQLKCVRANIAALSFYVGQGWREISFGTGEDGPYVVLERR